MDVKRGRKKFVLAGNTSKARTIALSDNDLMMHELHINLIYAFKAPVPSSQVLENGLSEALGEYQELGGRLSKDVNGRPVIALSGQGCGWIDADATVNLMDLMPFPPGDELLKLVPPSRGTAEIFLVQVTKFTCGSITIGIARHHQVVDGCSGAAFMEAWARAVKGSHFSSITTHDRSILRARDPPQPTFQHYEYTKSLPPPQTEQAEDHLSSQKRFRFSAENLQQIKAEAMKDSEESGFYTTFESLTGHLWRSVTKARGLAGNTKTRVVVSVNGRKRFPTPEDYFGNVVFHACAQSTVRDLIDRPLSYAVNLLQKAIRRVDKEYMQSALDFSKLHSKNPVTFARQYRHPSPSELVVTSWVMFKLYELDFGFGTPVFVGSPRAPTDGPIILTPSHTRDGSVDASLCLRAPHMEKLQAFLCEN